MFSRKVKRRKIAGPNSTYWESYAERFWDAKRISMEEAKARTKTMSGT